MRDAADQEDRPDDHQCHMIGARAFEQAEQEDRDRRIFGQIAMAAARADQLGIAMVAECGLNAQALAHGVDRCDEQQQRANRRDKCSYR
jgi:hypothetical protein